VLPEGLETEAGAMGGACCLCHASHKKSREVEKIMKSMSFFVSILFSKRKF